MNKEEGFLPLLNNDKVPKKLPTQILFGIWFTDNFHRKPGVWGFFLFIKANGGKICVAYIS